LFEPSLELSSYLAIALATRSNTMFEAGFSMKELGMTDEAHGLDRGPTVAFFWELV